MTNHDKSISDSRLEILAQQASREMLEEVEQQLSRRRKRMREAAKTTFSLRDHSEILAQAFQATERELGKPPEHNPITYFLFVFCALGTLPAWFLDMAGVHDRSAYVSLEWGAVITAAATFFYMRWLERRWWHRHAQVYEEMVAAHKTTIQP